MPRAACAWVGILAWAWGAGLASATAVDNLQITALSSSSVTVGWDANADATGYEVEVRVGSGSFSLETTATTTSYTRSVSATIVYSIRVAAVISGSTTGYSYATFQPTDAVPSASVASLAIQSLPQHTSSLTVAGAVLQWSPEFTASQYVLEARSVWEEGCSCPLKLRQWRPIDTVEQVQYGTDTVSSNTLLLTVDELFEVRVRPLNVHGYGDDASLMVRPSSVAPISTRSVVRAVSLSATTATLHVFNPAAHSFDILSCTSEDSATCGTTLASVSSTTEATLTGLSSATTYTVRAVGTNGAGTQNVSDATQLTFTTTDAAPADSEKVRYLHVHNTTRTSITLRWQPAPKHTKYTLLRSNLTTPALTAEASDHNSAVPVFVASATVAAGLYQLETDIADLYPTDDASWVTHTVAGLTWGVEITLCVVAGNNNGYASDSAGSCVVAMAYDRAPQATLATDARRWEVGESEISLWFAHPCARAFHVDVLQDGAWVRIAENEEARSLTVGSSVVATPGATYDFRVTAVNHYGVQGKAGWAVVNATATAAAPSPRLDNLRMVSTAASTGVALRWDDHPGATHYAVYDSDGTPLATVDQPYVELGASYVATVAALNNNGEQATASASTLNATATSQRTASVVADLKLAHTTATSVTLVFTRPGDSTHARVTVRDVGRTDHPRVEFTAASPIDSSADDTAWLPLKTERGTADAVSVTVPNLSAGTSYEFVVTAGNEHGLVVRGGDDGQGGVAITARPTDAVPSTAVASLRVTAIDSTSPTVSLAWAAAPDATHYTVYRREYTADDSNAFAAVGVSDATRITALSDGTASYTIAASELTSGKEYEVQVRAANSHGEQAEADASTVRARLEAIADGTSVADLRIVSVDDGSQAVLQWESDSRAFYHTVQTLSLTRNHTQWTTVEAGLSRGTQYPTVTYTLTGLDTSQTIAVRVAGGGEGGVETTTATTHEISLRASLSLPAPPSAVTVVAMTNTTATLQWDGVHDAFSYRVVRTSTDDGEVVADSDVRFVDARVNGGVAQLVVTGMTEGSEQTFAVFSGNSFGYEGVGTNYTVQLFDQRPGGPSVLQIVQVKPTTVTLSWDKVQYATSYDVQITDETESAAYETKVSSTIDTSATVTGLAPSTSYVFRVRGRTPTGSALDDDAFVSDVVTTAAFVTSLTLEGASMGLAGESWVQVGEL